jgi:hypothetical protein
VGRLSRLLELPLEWSGEWIYFVLDCPSREANEFNSTSLSAMDISFGPADSTWKCSNQLLEKMDAGAFLSRYFRGLELSFCSTSAI